MCVTVVSVKLCDVRDRVDSDMCGVCDSDESD